MNIAPITLPPFDTVAAEAAQARLDSLTKPQGSLGRLEELAVRLAGMTGNPRATFARKAIYVLAGDHGVTAEGVSAYPSSVTGQMVANFLAGGAAINVLARRAGAHVVVVDMGVASDLPVADGLVSRRIARGTANMAAGPAMTREQAIAAIEAGRALAAGAAANGVQLLATGEMGIGNTTAASAITAVITGEAPSVVTGRGTGVDDRVFAHKVAVIERALATNAPDPADALDVLSKVGGFEIGGLAGLILGAAERRVPVVLDGFIASAAALIAAGLAPGVSDYLIASHRSVECGHDAVLRHLGLAPLLDFNLRLGEGTGAAIAMQLIDDAVAIRDEMATFAEARVSGPAHD